MLHPEDIESLARAMVANDPQHAAAVAERNARNLAQAGDRTGAEKWTRVANEIRKINRPH